MNKIIEGVSEVEAPSKLLIKRAVHRHTWRSRQGLSERAFTWVFRGLVYPQIWEDPIVDLEALEIEPGSRIAAIASGGCNVMSYLSADPGSILAVDLNAAHIALNRLKIAAAASLPGYDEFFAFFGKADDPCNVDRYDRFIAPRLDEEARRYWEARSLAGRRRIAQFSKNFYRRGALGRCIGTGHVLARLLGGNPAKLMLAHSIGEQKRIFDRELAPVFDRPSVRWLMDRPSALFGLGIPPMQFEALSAGRPMSSVVRERLERLACDFPLTENYFAQQAFGRRYSGSSEAGLPPYLTPTGYRALKERGDRVSLKLMSFTDALAAESPASIDRFVLLDAQDWMTDGVLTDLWRQITRTASPQARVIFRTAAAPTLLPGRIPPELLGEWTYDEEKSLRLGSRDRSAIYGGFHLYIRRS